MDLHEDRIMLCCHGDFFKMASKTPCGNIWKKNEKKLFFFFIIFSFFQQFIFHFIQSIFIKVVFKVLHAEL